MTITLTELDELIKQVSKQAYTEPEHLVAIGMYKVLEMLYDERQRVLDKHTLGRSIN